MASKKTNRAIKIKIIAFIILAVICGVALIFTNPIEKALKIGNYATSASSTAEVVNACGLKIHYINMGQADATLIELPDGTKMLIDAGKSKEEDGTQFFAYLQNDLKLSTLDYLILTHCDQDHVGLMPDVLDKFEVKNIYRPFQIACSESGTAIDAEDLSPYVSTAKNITTKAYVKFIEKSYSETWFDSSTNSNVEANVFLMHDNMRAGQADIGSVNPQIEFSFEFYAPITTGETLLTKANQTIGKPVKIYKTNNNNASPIMLLTFLGQKFVFTGDAEKEVEADFLTRYKNDVVAKNAFKDVTVYKAGHHGSSTSSTAEFLAFINPTYTVVSCGKNNSYGHPSTEFLNRWETQISSQGVSRKQDVPLRTDVNGTIIFGVTSESEPVFISGVGASTFVMRWPYIVASVFLIGTIIIVIVRINTKSGVKTAKNVYRATKRAKKLTSK